MDKQLFSGVSPVQAAKELGRIVETVTCLECCKFYILPETAVCGHTLCHGCWIGRHTCPVCASPLKRKTLKSNAVIKRYSECVQSLVSMFEKLYNVKLEEYTQELPAKTMSAEKDLNKNVRAWLADSQNQFSAPVSSEVSTQPCSVAVELRTCDVQVHTDSKKTTSPVKIIVAPVPPQDDWDKIETVPDTEDLLKNKENVGPVNHELFSFDDEVYTTDHPRRSSRKREFKNDSKTCENSIDKHSNVSVDTDKFNKAKQNWSNVKRMRKEFSRLHKKNKNKLNVSIEMCKKTQSVVSKAATSTMESADSQQAITIDDCTPNIHHNEKEEKGTNVLIDDKCKPDQNDKGSSKDVLNCQTVNSSRNCGLQINENEKNSPPKLLKQNVNNHEKFTKSIEISDETTFKGNIPFLKKSALQTQKTAIYSKHENIESTNHIINCNTQTSDSDDIQITIKIGTTLTNILIKQKKNDIKVKLNSDQEVQTSQCVEKLIPCNISPSAPKDCDVQNIEINIGDKGAVHTVTQHDNCNKPNLNNKVNLDKTVSTKKNTASAETLRYEITESVEKELSKIMDYDVDSNHQVQSNKSVKNSQIDPQNDADNISVIVASCEQANIEEIELDADIFATGSVKESNVQLLKRTKYTPSEILMPSLKQNKMQTQKQADKRDRESNDDDIRNNKKLKVTAESNINEDTEQITSNKNKNNEDQSCSINYDLVMGQVFASIDADMVNDDKSQSIIKNSKSQIEICSRATPASQHSQRLRTQVIKKKVLGVSKLVNTSQNTKSNLHQKESENLLTLSNKESQIECLKHGPETQAHIESILTPGMCRDLASTSNVGSQIEQDDKIDQIQATPCQDKDDSDMSMYEETPQKASFTKKTDDEPGSRLSSGQRQMSKNTNTQESLNEKPVELQAMRSIINISDTDNTKTDKEETVIESKPRQTLETPSTINQFCNQIKHNSTPVARKSLNFVSNQDKTQNKSISILSKNTQAEEIIAKAFEPTPKLFAKPLPLHCAEKLCIAASSLTAKEVRVVESLCAHRKWVFVKEYTKDLTHLVVKVDEEGKSQRTVKFMCAVAAGKWIVNYDWVTECIRLGTKALEVSYEALDWTGDPGPMRARTASRKLFEGITFFCKPPFTVVNEAALKTMLEGAGGTVVGEVREVFVAGDSVRLLLAEPKHTQENQFTYLALELNIVPVNYEWALNCLGSYALTSIMDLLLCPITLLPPATQRWPSVIVAQEFDQDSSD